MPNPCVALVQMASANGDVRQVLSACEAALNVLVDDVASAEPTAGGPGCLHNIGGEKGLGLEWTQLPNIMCCFQRHQNSCSSATHTDS